MVQNLRGFSAWSREREREIKCKSSKQVFVTLSNATGSTGFIEERSGEKGGKSNSNFPPKRQPPRIQNLGENKLHSWNTLGERIMAGQVQKVQVAGQGSKGSMKIAGRPPQKGGLPCVHNTNMWSKPRKCEPGERKANFLEGFKRVKDNYWPAYTYWWPPRCVQHKYGVQGSRKWPRGGQHWLSSEETSVGER